jgi:hypothetical protein
MANPLTAEGAPDIGTLAGSHASMEHQNEVARENDYSFIRTSGGVKALVEEGALVPALGNKDYRLANVSHPATRPVTRSFIEQLGKDYHASCGSPLVVTSLTRPLNEQPRNASDLSVHPAGMAVDLRVPAQSSCRTWLEKRLLTLERAGILDVTREHHPSHYHVAVFPEECTAWLAPRLLADSIAARAASDSEAVAAAMEARVAEARAYLASQPATASMAPGPGPLATVLFALLVLSGVLAFFIVVRAPRSVAVKPNPSGRERRRS